MSPSTFEGAQILSQLNCAGMAEEIAVLDTVEAGIELLETGQDQEDDIELGGVSRKSSKAVS